jgi:hypothetical protein
LPSVQLEHALRPETPGLPLVGHGRVEVTVAEDDASFVEGRQHHLCQVLKPVGDVEQ